ncbi:MAG: TatD family hydrolase [Coriobacteriia bacterium]|nr:TatD family hydrolase [Coriobacteriia bacterium]MBS5478625.1 TatD family hydrolase [Coriobacteriia bacterium]
MSESREAEPEHADMEATDMPAIPTTSGFYGQPFDIPTCPEPTTFFATKKGAPFACPEPVGPISDSHTHLTSLRAIHPAIALARAALAGLDFIVTVVDPTDDACDPQSLFAQLADWQVQARAVLDAWGLSELSAPRVRMLPGCHPHNARLFDGEARAAIRELLADPLCCGIGEIGLDYHYDLSPRDVQQRVFEQQLRLACELDAPVSLHIREAHDDAYELLSRVGIPTSGAVLHCFDLGPEELRRFLDLGCSFGIGGAVSFASCEPTRQAMRECPAECIVTETDAPYMAPVPLRGTPCEPAHTAVTVDFLTRLRAEARGEDVAWQCATYAANARTLFDVRAGFALPADALAQDVRGEACAAAVEAERLAGSAAEGA